MGEKITTRVKHLYFSISVVLCIFLSFFFCLFVESFCLASWLRSTCDGPAQVPIFDLPDFNFSFNFLIQSQANLQIRALEVREKLGKF